MNERNKKLVVAVAFAAAAFFFTFGVFDWSLGDTDLLFAGLLSMAAAFLIEHLP